MIFACIFCALGGAIPLMKKSCVCLYQRQTHIYIHAHMRIPKISRKKEIPRKYRRPARTKPKTFELGGKHSRTEAIIKSSSEYNPSQSKALKSYRLSSTLCARKWRGRALCGDNQGFQGNVQSLVHLQDKIKIYFKPKVETIRTFR